MSLRDQDARDRRVLAAALRALDRAPLIAAVARETGLHPANVRAGILASIPSAEELDSRAPIARAARRREKSEAPVLVLLASNVFSACVRAILPSLLLGAPVIARPSRRNRAFFDAFVAALPSPFSEGLQVVEGSLGEGSLGEGALEEGALRAAIARAGLIHAYGSDATLALIARHLPAEKQARGERWFPHGAGLGVAWIGADDPLEPALDALATQIALYDQRGCFSPVALILTGRTSAEVAPRLAEAMRRCPPRGEVGELLPALRRFEETARALGDVYGQEALIAEAPLYGVGGRSLGVFTLERDAAMAHLVALGEKLKCVGLSESLRRGAAAQTLRSQTRARICALEEMQRPALYDPQDGWDPAVGLEAL